MTTLIDKVISGDLDEATKDIDQLIGEIIGSKLEAIRARIAFRSIGQLVEYPVTTRRQGRLNLVRIRVRSGKIQRKKKFSAVKGYTLRSGKLIRMRPAERLHRRLAARRAKLKRRSKRAQILRHTRIAMRKRRSLGLRAWSAHPGRK